MAEPYYTLESLHADQSVGFLVKRCGLVMTLLAERHFESQPISFTQWAVLMWLSMRPHASPTELAAHLGHDLGALTRMVDELHREGLVRRDRSEQDRRAVEIAITPEGRRMAQVSKRVVLDLMNELLAPYSRPEVDVMIATLQRLLSGLEGLLRRSMPVETPASAAKQPRRPRQATPRKPLKRGARE